MVSWFADGGVSAYDAPNGKWTAEHIKLLRTMSGSTTVDIEAITRISTGDSPGTAGRVDAVARLRIEGLDFWNTVTDGPDGPDYRRPTATMYVVEDSGFPSGAIPQPKQIMDAAIARGMVFRSSRRVMTGSAVDAQDVVFPIIGPVGNTLKKGTKYWLAVIPTSSRTGQPPKTDKPIPGTDPNTAGRAISFWTNRQPKAPVITSPIPGSVVNSGTDLTLAFTAFDDDAISGGPESKYTDLAGVEVQYAARPTPDDPTPVWTSLRMSGLSTPTLTDGWYIDAQHPTNKPPHTVGAYWLWSQGQIQLRCGGREVPPATAMLPAGNWQIRMRTFDYGHPQIATRYPWNIGERPGYVRPPTPGTAPAQSTSPWSTPVNITVQSQVPPPVPLSPVASNAVVSGNPVKLTWRYRNARTPTPAPQASYEVQVRAVGDPEWTPVASQDGNASNVTIPVGPLEQTQHMPHGDFEDGGTGGLVSSTNVNLATTLTNQSAKVYRGTKALEVRGTASDASSVLFDITNISNIRSATFSAAVNPNRRNTSVRFGWVRPNGTLLPGPMLGMWDWKQPSNGSTGNSTDAWNLISFDIASRPADVIGLRMTIDSGNNVTEPDKSQTIYLDDLSLITRPGLSPFPFEVGRAYEWRVRVTDTDGVGSDWSPSARFWLIPPPASGEVIPLPTETVNAATLGSGKHRAFIFRRGGKVRVAEVTGVTLLEWNRLRDDISDARVKVTGWTREEGEMLARLQTWAYELVIFRDNGYTVDRVWEGPITQVTYQSDSVTIKARDVMAYAYRRIIHQYFSDAGNGDSVVNRAARILQNVFAEDDPNLLSHLQPITADDDAKQYRSTPAMSRTAYEEIDDMASNSGLDYTAVGRAILLWGTKNRIGLLPVFRDENLGSSPIVSEYGMSFANRYVVSDGNGVYGMAEIGPLKVSGNDPDYGLVEMLSSSWASDSEEEAGTYTQEGLAKVVESFKGFAEQSLSSKYPPPVSVRVPDNTTLHPNTVVSIQHLVPGVAIPLHSTSTLREVKATQKLDSVKVTESDGRETIVVSMSPFRRQDNDMAEEETE